MRFLLPVLIVAGLFTSCTYKIYVAPSKVNCSSDEREDRTCYLMRSKPGDNWVLHMNDISNFEYKEGFTYHLKVKRSKSPYASLGGSVYQYSVVEVLDTEEYVAPPSETPGIEDKTWVLTEIISADGSVVEPVAEVTFNADIDKERIHGKAGCNNYFGSLSISDESIGTGALGATRMACEEPIMELEMKFLHYLEESESYFFEDDKLIIITNTDHKLIFE